jgi:hypothetical protein
MTRYAFVFAGIEYHVDELCGSHIGLVNFCQAECPVSSPIDGVQHSMSKRGNFFLRPFVSVEPLFAVLGQKRLQYRSDLRRDVCYGHQAT